MHYLTFFLLYFANLSYIFATSFLEMRFVANPFTLQFIDN